MFSVSDSARARSCQCKCLVHLTVHVQDTASLFSVSDSARARSCQRHSTLCHVMLACSTPYLLRLCYTSGWLSKFKDVYATRLICLWPPPPVQFEETWRHKLNETGDCAHWSPINLRTVVVTIGTTLHNITTIGIWHSFYDSHRTLKVMSLIGLGSGICNTNSVFTAKWEINVCV